MEIEILNQLIWIKWLLVTVVIVIAIGAIAFVGMVRIFSKPPEQVGLGGSFPTRARALLDQGKPEEVISLADERVLKFPADGQAYWYLGQACYRVGDLNRALVNLRKTQDLQPDWENSYTGPLIRAIEEKIAEGATKPDLKMVIPKPLFEKDDPPNDGTPLRA